MTKIDQNIPTIDVNGITYVRQDLSRAKRSFNT